MAKNYINIAVPWDVASYSFVESYQRFKIVHATSIIALIIEAAV